MDSPLEHVLREVAVGAASCPSLDTKTLELVVPRADPLARHLEADRLKRAAKAFTTRRIPAAWMRCIRTSGPTPRPGDLVLARVETIRHHETLHLPNGRRKRLFEGDEIIVAFGNRYAPDQFEAAVPKSLDGCHLVAAGGMAAKALSWNQAIRKGPTEIQPIGFVTREPGGMPINVAHGAIPTTYGPETNAAAVPIIAVAGTAMNAGKTTVAANLVRGMRSLGKKVGFAKVTGTGAAGDPWLIADAGADPVLDFTDGGYVSTYLVDEAEIERLFMSLVGQLRAARVDAIVLEIADGLFQPETSALLRREVFQRNVDGVIFAACDAMGAVAGAQWLEQAGLRVLAVSGKLTSAPLQSREVRRASDLSVYDTPELAKPASAAAILGAIAGGQDEAVGA